MATRREVVSLAEGARRLGISTLRTVKARHNNFPKSAPGHAVGHEVYYWDELEAFYRDNIKARPSRRKVIPT